MKWRHYLFFEEKMKNELSVGMGLWLLTLSAKDGVGSLQGLRASGCHTNSSVVFSQRMSTILEWAELFSQQNSYVFHVSLPPLSFVGSN